MDLGFFRRTQKKLVALIDVSASGIVAGVMEKGNSNARVLATVSLTLPAESRTHAQATKRLTTLANEANTKILDALSKTGDARAVTTVYLIVHAPWARSAVVRAVSNYDTDTKITAALMNDLAQKALSSGKDIDTKSLIETSIVRTELNGYPTSKPLGQDARSLQVYSMATECDPEITKGVGSAVAAVFPGAKLIWRSSTRELCSILQELNVATDEYVIADIQGDATDFIVVEGGVATRHLTADLGSSTMLERIAPGAPAEATLSTIRHIMHDQCDESACQTISESMAKAEPEFARQFGEVLGKELAQTKLPATLILVERNSGAEWLARFFSRIDFSQFTTTQQPFTVVTLGLEHLARAGVTSAEPASDLSASLAAAFVNIEESRA